VDNKGEAPGGCSRLLPRSKAELERELWDCVMLHTKFIVTFDIIITFFKINFCVFRNFSSTTDVDENT
jgi:hypothetical protein